MSRHSGTAAEYVESLAGRYVPDEEMPCGSDSYEFARQWRDCEDNCPGADKCVIHGYKPKVCEEHSFGRPVFVVRAGICDRQRAADSQKSLGGMMKASRIPPELSGCTFDSYKPVNGSTETAKKLSLSCAESGAGLILEGPPGTGKTHLAVAAALRAMQSGRSALFMPVVNLLEEIRRESSSVFGGPKGMMDELRGADCLVLDDFGMQKGSEWVDERLYGLINDRYNAGKQIIVTTNARSMEDFKSMTGKSGAQIESRLSVMAASFLIEAPDFRKRGGKTAS